MLTLVWVTKVWTQFNLCTNQPLRDEIYIAQLKTYLPKPIICVNSTVNKM